MLNKYVKKYYMLYIIKEMHMKNNNVIDTITHLLDWLISRTLKISNAGGNM